MSEPTSSLKLPSLTEDFWLTTKALFLSNTPFPDDYQPNNPRDVEMEPEDHPQEETKAIVSSKPDSRYPKQPFLNNKEMSLRQWDINLRDKLNLNKFTKSLHMGKSLLKHRMNEHKETFLPKPYTPFKFSSQQMYKIIKPEEPEKIMREINIDQGFEVDYAELLTKYEFPAVLRLKKKFMSWL